MTEIIILLFSIKETYFQLRPTTKQGITANNYISGGHLL
jgi:hypothetical protein